MFSLILSLATRFLLPLLLLLSVFLLLRGHNQPGGGFSAGLVGGIAVALYMLGLNLKSVRRVLPVQPLTLIAAGLTIAVISGIWALLAGDSFLQGHWFENEIPVLGGMHLGTPILFDVGVYCVAAGAMLLAITILEETR